MRSSNVNYLRFGNGNISFPFLVPFIYIYIYIIVTSEDYVAQNSCDSFHIHKLF